MRSEYLLSLSGYLKFLVSLVDVFIPLKEIGWGYKGDDEIPELILRLSDLKHPKMLYVGNDIEYFKGKGIDAMTPEKFIEKYNKNPRKYEKK